METAISKGRAASKPTTAISRTAARLSLAAALVFLVLLAALHVIKPEFDPSWRFISEYSIGDHGWIMVLAFLSLALSCTVLFIAIRSQIRTTSGKVGLILLLAAAVGLTIAAIFRTDPITVSGDVVTTRGALHGVGTVIGTLGIPIAAAFITRGLRRNEAWSSARRSLLWATGLACIGLLMFEVSFAIMLPGHELGPDVRIGWPNRFLIVTYAVWLMVVAWRAAQLSGQAPISATGTSVIAKKVISKDGTPIAFDETGAGPPVVVVGGALSYRSFSWFRKLAGELSKDFTVINYDRRGRGDSGDTKPYSVQREVEDIAALIEEVGGSSSVFGWSSGAALALEAAASGLPIAKLGILEPPFMVGDPKHRPPADYQEQMQRLISEDRRSDAVKLFMKVVGVPGPAIAVMQLFPFWRAFKAVAHTLPYDAAVMGDFSLPTERLASITVPTLAIWGEKSPQVLRDAAQAVADTVPNAQRRSLEHQSHGVKPAVLAPALKVFFTGSGSASGGDSLSIASVPTGRDHQVEEDGRKARNTVTRGSRDMDAMGGERGRGP